MSVLKYKDSKGNWVEASGIYCGGQLKTDIITRATENTFDLTKYMNCNKFYMIYTVQTGANDKICIFSSTNTADGSRWELSGNTTTSIGSGWDSDLIALASPVKSAGFPYETQTYHTSYENGIFTHLTANAYGIKEVGEKALVIYAE